MYPSIYLAVKSVDRHRAFLAASQRCDVSKLNLQHFVPTECHPVPHKASLYLYTACILATNFLWTSLHACTSAAPEAVHTQHPLNGGRSQFSLNSVCFPLGCELRNVSLEQRTKLRKCNIYAAPCPSSNIDLCVLH